MKFIIPCFLGILASCSYEPLNGEWSKDVSLENLKLSVYEAGCEKEVFELQLNDEEKKKLMIWLKSFAGSHIDFNTYAPAVVLRGKTLKINFLKKRTVISYRKGSDQREPWGQYSRSVTADDQHIKSWLRKIVR